MAKFRYIGESPNGPFEQYGAVFEKGAVAEVTDATGIVKLTNNPFFERVGASGPVEETTPETPKRKPGRPRKDVMADDNAISD